MQKNLFAILSIAILLIILLITVPSSTANYVTTRQGDWGMKIMEVTKALFV
jgi:hypothetical protein